MHNSFSAYRDVEVNTVPFSSSTSNARDLDLESPADSDLKRRILTGASFRYGDSGDRLIVHNIHSSLKIENVKYYLYVKLFPSSISSIELSLPWLLLRCCAIVKWDMC